MPTAALGLLRVTSVSLVARFSSDAFSMQSRTLFISAEQPIELRHGFMLTPFTLESSRVEAMIRELGRLQMDGSISIRKLNKQTRGDIGLSLIRTDAHTSCRANKLRVDYSARRSSMILLLLEY